MKLFPNFRKIKKALLPEKIRNYKGLKLKDIDNLFKEIYLDGVSDLDKTQQNLLKRNLSTAAIMTVDEEKQGNTLARAAVDRARQLINTKLEAIYDTKRHHIVSKNQVEKNLQICGNEPSDKRQIKPF